MGLGLLASRVLRFHTNRRNLLRTIVTKPELQSPEASAAAAAPDPTPDLPPRTPVAGARVHFPNPDDAIEVFVDGYPVKIPKGMTVLQACEIAGVDIPRFCYHSRLSIAGNCRMCLVEVEKSPKPVASCAMPALPGMKIKTDTPVAKKAREGVMEFLLMNHPLDCPICDQGGECDLQDQSMAFGSDRGRFTEMNDLWLIRILALDFDVDCFYLGVMMWLNWVRCVRFATEIAGVQDLGMLGRGIGSNIRIDSRGPEVMRILPRLNEDINEEWISDKTRFFYDGLKRQRLNDPMIRVLMGASRLFLKQNGSNNVWCEGNGPSPNADLRSGYIMNTGISGLEKVDVFLLVGTQPRIEAAMVNARIRKTIRATNAKVGYIGPPTDFNYDCEHIGTGPQALVEIAEGRHPFFSTILNAKNPAIIVGAGIFERMDKDAIFSTVETIAKKGNVVRPDWNGLNVLLLNAAQAAALDLGLVPESSNSIESAKFVYLMGADDVNLDKLPKDAFMVYQGHHGDRGVYHANVILPAAAFTEKEGTYVNTEGCAQQTLPAVPTVGDARDDWKIIRALSEVAGVRLPYDTIGAVQSRIRNVAPNLLSVDEREPATFGASLKPECTQSISSTPFKAAIENFYMTDCITRASKIMAQCSALLLKK
ncbi:hypothetical protein GH714_033173 [Hevea brasiliensis]|uniref:2Fe-2S ferredoxin-type domain-containing protein n=1 Tax=Hevea brasiliensis TaxID=3981 RepID=A0A6A6L5I7_HEVBR|nr:hypothetical protein GH714_033173 [Hevea brasiliensis]